jgi:hypothetical protein
MSNYGNSFFSPAVKQFSGASVPVWLDVKERKIAGGSFSISGLAKGSKIPVGTPVNLAKMGGTAVILDAYVVQSNVAADGTSLVVKSLTGVIPDPSGLVVGKVTETTGIAAKAVELGTGTEGSGADAGKFTFTITANSLGALTAGDILYICAEAGSSKAMLRPTGLSWHEVVVDEGVGTATYGTVAVVTKGQILADRAPQISAYFKSLLPGITFEYES